MNQQALYKVLITLEKELPKYLPVSNHLVNFN